MSATGPVFPDGFTPYTGARRRRHGPGLRLSTTARGAISLSEEAFAALGRPSAVLLAYSRRERRIAVQPAAASDHRAYRVQHQPGGGPWKISAASFLRHVERLGVSGALPVRRLGSALVADL
jgi:hypothetical protein